MRGVHCCLKAKKWAEVVLKTIYYIVFGSIPWAESASEIDSYLKSANLSHFEETPFFTIFAANVPLLGRKLKN